jgi:hypothetical protein
MAEDSLTDNCCHLYLLHLEPSVNSANDREATGATGSDARICHGNSNDHVLTAQKQRTVVAVDDMSEPSLIDTRRYGCNRIRATSCKFGRFQAVYSGSK